MGSVKVNITNRAVVTALETPGAPVYQFMETLAEQIEDTAWRRSPVNNPMNATHRGGITGTYKAGWSWDRRGTHAHHVTRRVVNSAGHAVFVEYGRSMSRKLQVFGFTGWEGEIRYVRGQGPFAKRKGSRKQQRSKEGRLSKWVEANDLEFGGYKTAERRGRYVLTFATNSALVRNGLRAGI